MGKQYAHYREIRTLSQGNAMNKSEGKSDKSLLEKNVITYLHEHRQCVVGTSLNNIPFVAKVY